MEPRYDQRPASRFHAIKPRHVKIVTTRHERVTGVTWDILGSLRLVAHHDSPLGRWGTADATSLLGPLLVSAGTEDHVPLEPRQILRLAVLQ
jgi:hypothetical protein